MTEPELTPPEPPAPTTPEAIVATNVRRLRECLGISQAELAERATKTGHVLGEMAIWTLENGKRRIRVDDLFGLGEALGVTPQQLLTPDVDPASTGRLYEVLLDGGIAERVIATRVEPDDQGWLNFYLHGERVFFASIARMLCVRIGEPQ